MIITCPSCSSRYPVDASTFAPSGRKVRCAKCGNTWHQAPPSDLGGEGDENGREIPKPAAADDDTIAIRPAPLGQKPLFNSDASKSKPIEPKVPEKAVAPTATAEKAPAPTPPPAPASPVVTDVVDDDVVFAPTPVETTVAGAPDTPVKLYDLEATSTQVQTGGAMRRYLSDVASMRRGRVFGAIGWMVLTLFVAGTIYGAVEYRREIAAFWPSTIRLYEAAGAPINLVGFELAHVSYERQDENGLPVLAIKGEVLNISGETRRVPRLRVGLRDDKQHELYYWTFELTESELKADGKASFTTRLSSPPPSARDLEVRFVEPGEEPGAEIIEGEGGNDSVAPTDNISSDVGASDEGSDEEASGTAAHDGIEGAVHADETEAPAETSSHEDIGALPAATSDLHQP